MSIRASYPTIKPALLLDFAGARALDPRVTFARASTGTYFNSQGLLTTAAAGVPRFDHNPATGESLGLLIEEQRTNLLTYSESFTSGSWLQYHCTTAVDQVAAPDGATTADKLTLTEDGNGVAYCAIGAGQRTASCFFKKGTNSTFLLSIDSVGSVSVDAATGAVVGLAGGTASVTALSGGWFRVAYTYTYNVGTTYFNAGIAGGTNGQYCYIWGAQLEEGAFASSYISTTSAAATRPVDYWGITGTNFSSWFNQGAIVLLGEAWYSLASSRFTGATLSNPWGFSTIGRNVGGAGPTYAGAYVTAYSSDQFYAEENVVSYGSKFSVAARFIANNFAASINGRTPITDSSGRVLECSSISSGSHLSGHLSKLAYFNLSLTNAQLQAISLK